jgi:hypothetical protein
MMELILMFRRILYIFRYVVDLLIMHDVANIMVELILENHSAMHCKIKYKMVDTKSNQQTTFLHLNINTRNVNLHWVYNKNPYLYQPIIK